MENIGDRLRHHRERQGLSQRALAKMVGVSNGTISVIEKGEQDPTVGLLKRILVGLKTSMSDFFDEEPQAHETYFYPNSELVEIGSGPVSYRQIGHDLQAKALQILLERYEPGADTGPTRLTHEGEEGGIIVSGRLEVSVKDQRRTLGPGDAYYFPSTLPHKFRNVGKEPCVLITACTPPSF